MATWPVNHLATSARDSTAALEFDGKVFAWKIEV